MPQPSDPSLARYEIEIGVRLGGRTREAFAAFDVIDTGPGCVLVGPVTDQAALYGVLARLRDLGIPLVGVRRTSAGTADDASRPRLPG